MEYTYLDYRDIELWRWYFMNLELEYYFNHTIYITHT
jgi:hypothetical protein